MSNFLLLTEALVALAIAFVAILVLRGLLPIAIRWQNRDTVWHFATGILLVVGALSLRLLYWTYMPVEWRQVMGKPAANTIFGLIALYGGYLILRLQWLIIPDEDRKNYSIWTAPWYPRDLEWRMEVIMRFFHRRKETDK